MSNRKNFLMVSRSNFCWEKNVDEMSLESSRKIYLFTQRLNNKSLISTDISKELSTVWQTASFYDFSGFKLYGSLKNKYKYSLF